MGFPKEPVLDKQINENKTFSFFTGHHLLSHFIGPILLFKASYVLLCNELDNAPMMKHSPIIIIREQRVKIRHMYLGWWIHLFKPFI